MRNFIASRCSPIETTSVPVGLVDIVCRLEPRLATCGEEGLTGGRLNSPVVLSSEKMPQLSEAQFVG